jgi:hypothetical protein
VLADRPGGVPDLVVVPDGVVGLVVILVGDLEKFRIQHLFLGAGVDL